MTECPLQNALHRDSRGFTLVEMAIVLIIVSLLIGGMMMSLTSQQDIASIRETEKRLGDTKDALIGFATANGRLPCPAAPPPAGGTESPPETGACTNALQSGYVPASLLATTPTDDRGYALDAWNNPIRYAVINATINSISNPFTTSGAMKSLGIETISLASATTSRKFLLVCSSANGLTASDCGTSQQITDSAIAIIYSTGKNGVDETRGGADDIVFVSTQTADSFDDRATWLSPNILFNRMISAGRLP